MADKEPISPEGLKCLSKGKLEDATILLKNGRFDTAYYLCGYAVELALKRQICLTLGWDEYVKKDFSNDLKSFMIHKLDVLLFLSGIEKKVKREYFSPWAAVRVWDSEVRYSTLGVEKKRAELMLSSTEALLKALEVL
jgi:HEPN domain-containing protein